uniref:ATP synthase F0 subunit 8 n=1 Tax=Exurapteryx aristidaria TaxID=2655033 RepID=UPI0026E3E61F|nr:ATP synthase F0 subunit 8 [Exurapteryx aristidaria]WJJ44281.1 ATP synthase F0 subunit 8 [Exurapteryx aristidaria]
MPQMMPINWMMSFILFILIFLIFNILNYYIINNKKLNKSENKKLKLMNNLNWKW